MGVFTFLSNLIRSRTLDEGDLVFAFCVGFGALGLDEDSFESHMFVFEILNSCIIIIV